MYFVHTVVFLSILREYVYTASTIGSNSDIYSIYLNVRTCNKAHIDMVPRVRVMSMSIEHIIWR